MCLTEPSTSFCEEKSFFWSSDREILFGSFNNSFICDSLAVIESNGVACVFPVRFVNMYQNLVLQEENSFSFDWSILSLNCLHQY